MQKETGLAAAEAAAAAAGILMVLAAFQMLSLEHIVYIYVCISIWYPSYSIIFLYAHHIDISYGAGAGTRPPAVEALHFRLEELC